MTTLHHDLTANCSAERIWALLADLEAVAHYNPMVASARVTSPSAIGIGATRRCEMRPKGTVVERVTQWQDGRSLGVEIAESDWPIEAMEWVTKVESQGPSRCRITQRLDYRMKYGVLGAIINKLAMQRRLGSSIDATLRAMITLAEADASTTKGAAYASQ